MASFVCEKITEPMKFRREFEEKFGKVDVVLDENGYHIIKGRYFREILADLPSFKSVEHYFHRCITAGTTAQKFRFFSDLRFVLGI